MSVEIPKYLPQSKKELKEIVDSYTAGNKENAIALLSERLPDVYVKECIDSLVEEARNFLV